MQHPSPNRIVRQEILLGQVDQWFGSLLKNQLLNQMPWPEYYKVLPMMLFVDQH